MEQQPPEPDQVPLPQILARQRVAVFVLDVPITFEENGVDLASLTCCNQSKRRRREGVTNDKSAPHFV